jgi:hypothetical protein
MKRRSIVIVSSVVLLLALGLALLYLGSHATPDKQEALSDLNVENLNEFKDRFNRSADEPRIILLLSPT